MKRLEVPDAVGLLSASSGRALSRTSRTSARMRSRVELSSIKVSAISKQQTANSRQPEENSLL